MHSDAEGQYYIDMLKLRSGEQHNKAAGIPRGEVKDIGWGTRSVPCAQPTIMVMNHRPVKESGNVDAVLDGKTTFISLPALDEPGLSQ